MNKPLAIAYKPFRTMKANTSKARSFYTQSQQVAARVLFIVWLLASSSLEGVLAAPERQMTPATTTSPGDPSPTSAPPMPGGQLSSEPDKAGSSSQQHSAMDPSSAVVAPSTATPSALQQLMSQLSTYILLAKRSHFFERTAATGQLAAILADKGVCVLYGLGGAGKSTLASFYGHGCKDMQAVRWISAENSFKLQEGYEQLAQELQVIYQPLAKKLGAAPSQYRQGLARMVYQALARNNQPTLLILDNAQDASLVADYLLYSPAAIQAIITPAMPRLSKASMISCS